MTRNAPAFEGGRKERNGANAMKYTPGSANWGAVKRDPIDTFGIVSQSQTRHATMAANASKTPPPRAHKLGFASSDAMPVIQQPRVLFDAFQDVTRTGPLPAALREGSMPLYFSLNRKYLSQYDYMQSHGPDGLGKRFKNLGKTQGAIHRELLEKGHAARPATEDELLGQAELTMGRKLLARPTTSLGLTGGGCRMRVLPDELVHCGDATSFPVWQVMRSETKGFPYWYNRVTGESRWTPPGDNLEIINSQNHLVMPEDRSWYTYQTGYYGGRPDLSSVGMTTSQMASLQIKPEYVVDHLRGHRKTLQRRLAAPDEAMGAQPGVSYTRDEMDGVSDYPEKFNAMQNGASWEGKLLRLIVQKCEEHSGRHVSMRETFMRLDKDKVGFVSEHNLKEVLQNYTGMTLSNKDMAAVTKRFCGPDGKISYLDVCRAMMGDGVHPLGGPWCVNIGSTENQSKGFEKVSIPNKSNTRLLVDLTAR